MVASALSTVNMCQHCCSRGACKPRGLCRRCFDNMSIRTRYPHKVVYPSRIGVTYKVCRVGEPTDALPGSEEKLNILILRASRGEELWHPKDAKG